MSPETQPTHALDPAETCAARPNAARDAEIVQAYVGGETQRSISARHGVSRSRVYQIISKASLGSPRRPLTEADEAEIVALFDAGHAVARIEVKVGRCTGTINEVLARHGRDRARRSDVAWSGEDDALLLDLYGRPGHSASTIAARLGRTRNAVIGRRHRIAAEREAKA